MTQLLLIRHATNDSLKADKLVGWTPGVNLNEEGQAQANALVTRLEGVPIAAIYSSPLERAVQTAQALAQARQVLARLDTRQQALILGHAVPMPVVVRTRDYDANFYASAGWADGQALKALREKGSRQLYGDDQGL